MAFLSQIPFYPLDKPPSALDAVAGERFVH
jgi:hypothetical protein